MQDLIIGGLLGIATGWLYTFLYRPLYHELTKFRMLPYRAGRRKGFLQRVRRLMSPRVKYELVLLKFLPLFLLGTSLIIWGPQTQMYFPLRYISSIGFGFTAGSMFILLAGLPFEMHQNQKLIRKVREMVIERVMRHALPEEQTDLLRTAWKNGPDALKKKVIGALGRNGTPEARQMILEIAEDETHFLHEEARSELEELDSVISGEKLLSAKDLPLFIDEMAFWHRQIYAGSGFAQKANAEEKTAEYKQIVEDIVHSQLHLRQGYPDLFCRNCLARAVELEQELWTYVLCRHCGDVTGLETGIREVVGVIGDFPDRTLTDDVLYLRLWDPHRQKAVFAEIDRLEITGGADFDYDWAVSAAVAALKEHPPQDGWNLPVLLQQTPVLDANSRKLLAGIAGNIEER